MKQRWKMRCLKDMRERGFDMAGNNGSSAGALTVTGQPGDILFKIVIGGDLSGLDQNQKMEYYNRFCDSLNLNPITRPFEFIKFDGKEMLYAKKDATEQLRKLQGISIEDLSGKMMEDIYTVTVKVKDFSGRTDMATGAIYVATLKGKDLANAFMKAETKAKRRATLSICGLGILDESEIEDIEKEPKIINITEKKVGDIDQAVKAISDSKTHEEVEKYEKMIQTRSWTDDELKQLKDLIEIQKIKVMVDCEPHNSEK